MARLSVLCSGSSGNCTYVRYGDETVLIDAGVSAKKICELLAKNNISPATVKGIFITHEHVDHIRGLRVIANKHGIHIYANTLTLAAISAAGQLPDDTLVHKVEAGETVSFSGISVTSFRTSHDAARSQGYRISCADGRTASYITDLGVFSDEVYENVKGSHTVVLEANHDLHMLRTGPYPYNVKQRIASDHGHLSNDDSAAAAVKLVSSGTGRLILAHISRDNNSPELAANTVDTALMKAGLSAGKDYLLYVAGKEDGREYIF